EATPGDSSAGDASTGMDMSVRSDAADARTDLVAIDSPDASPGDAATGPDVAPASCEPQSFCSEGMCYADFGIFWDGHRCVFAQGCHCVGADCGGLYSTWDDCQAAHEHCAADAGAVPPRCGPGTDCGGSSFCWPRDGGRCVHAE